MKSKVSMFSVYTPNAATVNLKNVCLFSEFMGEWIGARNKLREPFLIPYIYNASDKEPF